MGKGSPIYQLHTYKLGIMGLVGILILFTPGLFPFKWQQIQDKTIWGTFLLLGGAITMTAAMAKSGLAGWLADGIHEFVVGHTWWMVVLIGWYTYYSNRHVIQCSRDCDVSSNRIRNGAMVCVFRHTSLGRC